jgi:hypothetical protein
MLQHSFENNWLMVFYNWSFLQVDVAIIANHDTPMLMPLELNFQKKLSSTISSNESCAKFSTMFSISITDAWLVTIGILSMFI